MNAAAPATWHVGVSSTTSNGDGSGFTEPAVGNYGRAAVTNNATNFPPAATVAGKTLKLNGTAVALPNPTADWGAPHVEVGFFTASTGGTPRHTVKLKSPITVLNGQTPVQFAVSQIEIECKPGS